MAGRHRETNLQQKPELYSDRSPSAGSSGRRKCIILVATQKKRTLRHAVCGNRTGSFSSKNGGGGGSRTRVRKYSTVGVYILSPAKAVYRAANPPGQGLRHTILPEFRQADGRRARPAIPLRDVLSSPAGEGRKDGSLKRLQRKHSRLRLYLSSTGLTRWVETSVCSPSLHTPVEPVSPPCFDGLGIRPKAKVKSKKAKISGGYELDILCLRTCFGLLRVHLFKEQMRPVWQKERQ